MKFEKLKKHLLVFDAPHQVVATLPIDPVLWGIPCRDDAAASAEARYCAGFVADRLREDVQKRHPDLVAMSASDRSVVVQGRACMPDDLAAWIRERFVAEVEGWQKLARSLYRKTGRP